MNHEELSLEAVTFFNKIQEAISKTFKQNVPKGKQAIFHEPIPLLYGATIEGIAEDETLIIDSEEENIDDIPIFIDPLMAVLKKLEDKSFDIL